MTLQNVPGTIIGKQARTCGMTTVILSFESASHDNASSGDAYGCYTAGPCLLAY